MKPPVAGPALTLEPQTTQPAPRSTEAIPQRPRSRRAPGRTSLLARGEPMTWLTGGALVLALGMIVGALVLIVVEGTQTFWPGPLLLLRTTDGKAYLGELAATDARGPEGAAGPVRRRELRTGNFDLSHTHFQWVSDSEVLEETLPEWALVIERLEWGRFYGFPLAFLLDGQVNARDPDEVWARYNEYHAAAQERGRRRHRLLLYDRPAVEAREKEAQKLVDAAERAHGPQSAALAAAARNREQVDAWARQERARIDREVQELTAENARYQLVVRTAQGQEQKLSLADIVRAYPANQLDTAGKWAVYRDRWGEFLADDPREANSEGGVFPAIWGTVVMTLLMSLAVVPFGVLAALYLREYARKGMLISIVRIAVNNLAGVPSIVFGMFGLVFFCYLLGGGIDRAFFASSLPNPTYGKGTILWASLTLALLTLPVVIVATEEALAAVPGSLREGSYACGASKWQTIRRIVLPRAMPGILTGFILAMARGAGEVAPIMLVGAVKLAPSLPLDDVFPFVHPQRSFMHLGFHIFDLGFQSQNGEAAKPMVFTTTLLLIALVAVLNGAAIWLRARLRGRFLVSKF